MNILKKMHTEAKRLQKLHPKTAYADLLKKAAKAIKGTTAGKVSGVKKTAAHKKAPVHKIIPHNLVEMVTDAVMKSRLHHAGVKAERSVLKNTYRKLIKKKLPTAAKIKELVKKGHSQAAIIKQLSH